MDIISSINPAPWFHQMREEKPVYFDPAYSFFFGVKGAWQAFRYHDVQKGLSDYTLFSNEFIPETPGDVFRKSLFVTDPPLHNQLRSLVSSAFAPSAMKRLEDWLYNYCEKLLSSWLKSGQMNFTKDFADILPVSVIAQLLGIPAAYHQQMRIWTDAITGDRDTIGAEAYVSTQQEMIELFTKLSHEREKDPQPDLITHLLQAEIDGEKLSIEEQFSICMQLLVGGTETTDGLLGNAMLSFIEHPEVQEHLVRYPADIPKAINEVLRLRAPLMAVPRIIKQDLLLDNQQLRKGDLINLWVASANRDASIFPKPDTFDMHRDHSRILSFGHGIHYCVGAYLAKLEARIAFEVVFQHLRDIRIAPGTVLLRQPSTIAFRFRDLSILFNTNI